MADFITSDSHFFHTNIIRYNSKTRPYGRPGLVEDMKRLSNKNISIPPAERTAIRNDIEAAVHNMNESMIQAWNAVVGPYDTLYHLGDFSFGKPEQTKSVLERLNGNIRLVRGNHDPVTGTGSEVLRARCEWIRDYYEMRIGDDKIVMMHFPLAVWNRQHHGAIMLHGHSHGSYKAPGRILDVGWDSLFKVASLTEIVEQMKKIPIYVNDHHEPGVD